MDPIEVAEQELQRIREARKRLQILKLERLSSPYGSLLWAALQRSRTVQTASGLETLPGEDDLADQALNRSKK